MAVLVTSVALVSIVRTGPAARSSRVAELFGGEEGLAVVTHPDRVEAFRLDPTDKPPGGSRLNYPVTSGPIAVPGALMETLTSALTSDRSYAWNFAVACVPSYGVRLSFYQGQRRVDVLLCRNCCMLLALHHGVEVGVAQFNPMQAVLVDAAKKLFPDDPAIQSLSREGGKYVHGL